MPFETPLEVRKLAPREWELLSPLKYRGNRELLKVPAGFTTDFASVPRLFWPLIAPSGSHTESAVLHDWAYSEQPRVIVLGHHGQSFGLRRITRREADGLFLRALREQGVAAWKRCAMYLAVRFFGGFVWRRARS